jgi:hypothetical protein
MNILDIIQKENSKSLHIVIRCETKCEIINVTVHHCQFRRSDKLGIGVTSF